MYSVYCEIIEDHKFKLKEVVSLRSHSQGEPRHTVSSLEQLSVYLIS